MIANILTPVRWLACQTLILPVRFYQAVFRPIMPSVCPFTPSCSDYFILAVKKHGPVKGACKGAWRLCRCNPFNRGGYDPP